MSKQPIEWHKQNLTNQRRSLETAKQKVERANDEVVAIRDSVNALAFQIRAAEAEGRDGFDADRYKTGRPKRRLLVSHDHLTIKRWLDNYGMHCVKRPIHATNPEHLRGITHDSYDEVIVLLDTTGVNPSELHNLHSMLGELMLRSIAYRTEEV